MLALETITIEHHYVTQTAVISIGYGLHIKAKFVDVLTVASHRLSNSHRHFGECHYLLGSCRPTE